MRRGQIRRSYLSDGWQSNPVWGQSGPAYKPPRFQSGPGKTGDLYSDWLLSRDAVTDERRGSFGNASAKHSWFQAGILEFHWPLTSAGSRRWTPSGTNFHWLTAQAGQRGQPRGMPNFYWLLLLAVSFFSYVAVSISEASDELLKAAWGWLVQEQARSGHPGGEG